MVSWIELGQREKDRLGETFGDCLDMEGMAPESDLKVSTF